MKRFFPLLFLSLFLNCAYKLVTYTQNLDFYDSPSIGHYRYLTMKCASDRSEITYFARRGETLNDSVLSLARTDQDRYFKKNNIRIMSTYSYRGKQDILRFAFADNSDRIDISAIDFGFGDGDRIRYSIRDTGLLRLTVATAGHSFPCTLEVARDSIVAGNFRGEKSIYKNALILNPFAIFVYFKLRPPVTRAP